MYNKKLSLFIIGLAKVKSRFSSQTFHPSYHKVEEDGLSTAQHIALNDAYIRCMVKFNEPMIGIEEDSRTEWVSKDKKSIICTFTYNTWYNLYLKMGIGLEKFAKECVTIKSANHEDELKIIANA